MNFLQYKTQLCSKDFSSVNAASVMQINVWSLKMRREVWCMGQEKSAVYVLTFSSFLKPSARDSMSSACAMQPDAATASISPLWAAVVSLHLCVNLRNNLLAEQRCALYCMVYVLEMLDLSIIPICKLLFTVHFSEISTASIKPLN